MIRHRIIISVFSLMTACSFLLSGCGANNGAINNPIGDINNGQSDGSNDIVSGTPVTQASEITEEPISGVLSVGNISLNYTKYDLDESLDGIEITLDDENTATPEGTSYQDGILKISSAGTYILSGNLTNGQIRIAVGEEDKVRLILNGVNITNSSDSCIYAESGDKLIVTLADDTVNTLTDSDTSIKSEDDSRGPAALYGCISITVNGSGTLNVRSSYNNAIGTKKTLKIVNGILNLTAENAGLKGNNAVDICGGAITVNSVGDGIKTEETENAEKGYVFISGGKIVITTESDGINGSLSTVITGGIINITTTGTEMSSDSSGSGVIIAPGNMGGGGKPGGGGGGWGGFGEKSASAPASKGIKAGTMLYISGGSITVSSTGHALHSGGTATVEGSAVITLTSSSGKGIQGHGDVTISGGTINIVKSTEGIESKTNIYISGGDTTVYATDDGINMASTSGCIYISGGKTTVSVSNGDTDGVDSNNTVAISGGIIIVEKIGSSAQQGAFDAERTVTINGGTVVIVGSQSSPANSYSGKSVKFPGVSFNAGEYQITDSSGNVIFSFNVTSSFSSAWIGSELFESGSAYKLVKNGSTVASWTQSSNSVNAK